MCVFVINFILLPSLFYQLFVGLQSIYVCLSNSSTSVCPTSVISSPSLPPTSKTPFLVLIFCWLEECDKVLILLCCLAFVAEHFTGHLWKQSFGLPELLVWSIKAVSVISSIWLCLVRAVNKCDLRSATSQTEGSASAFHQPLLAVILVEQMKRRQILQVLSLPWSSIKRLYWKLSLCLHVVGFLFSEALLTYCLLLYLPPGHELVSRPPLGGTHKHFCEFFAPSAFSHMKTVESGLPAFLFCVFLEQKWSTKIKLLRLLSWLKRTS